MKRLILSIILISIIGAITGCETGRRELCVNIDEEKPIIINFPSMWVGEDSKAKVFLEMTEQFNKLNKDEINVVVEEIPDAEAYRQKMRANLAASQIPDLFIINEAGRYKLEKYVSTGKLMDWTPYLEEDLSWKNNFIPGSLETNTWNNKVMILPIEQHIVPIIYNKELLEKAGFKEFPKTYDEYFKLCDALLEQEVIPVSAMMAGGTNDQWFANQLFTNYAVSIAGRDIVSEACEGRSSFMDRSFIEAAKFIQKMYKYMNKDVLSIDYPKTIAYFTNGQAAMIGNGAWMLSHIKEAENNLSKKVGFAGAPGSGSWLSTIGAHLAAGVQENIEKEKAIAKYVKFMTSTENVKKWYLDCSVNFCIKLDLKEGEGNELAQLWLSEAKKAPFMATTILWSSKPEVQKVFTENLAKLLVGKMTAEEYCRLLEEANRKTSSQKD